MGIIKKYNMKDGFYTSYEGTKSSIYATPELAIKSVIDEFKEIRSKSGSVCSQFYHYKLYHVKDDSITLYKEDHYTFVPDEPDCTNKTHNWSDESTICYPNKIITLSICNICNMSKSIDVNSLCKICGEQGPNIITYTANELM